MKDLDGIMCQSSSEKGEEGGWPGLVAASGTLGIQGVSLPSGKCIEMVALLSFYQDPAGKVCGPELPTPTLRA